MTFAAVAETVFGDRTVSAPESNAALHCSPPGLPHEVRERLAIRIALARKEGR